MYVYCIRVSGFSHTNKRVFMHARMYMFAYVRICLHMCAHTCQVSVAHINACSCTYAHVCICAHAGKRFSHMHKRVFISIHACICAHAYARSFSRARTPMKFQTKYKSQGIRRLFRHEQTGALSLQRFPDYRRPLMRFPLCNGRQEWRESTHEPLDGNIKVPSLVHVDLITCVHAHKDIHLLDGSNAVSLLLNARGHTHTHTYIYMHTHIHTYVQT